MAKLRGGNDQRAAHTYHLRRLLAKANIHRIQPKGENRRSIPWESRFGTHIR